AKSGGARGFDVQNAELVRFSRPKVEIQPAGVVIASGFRGPEQRGKISGIRFWRRENKNGDRGSKLARPTDREKIVFAVEREKGGRSVRDEFRTLLRGVLKRLTSPARLIR